METLDVPVDTIEEAERVARNFAAFLRATTAMGGECILCGRHTHNVGWFRAEHWPEYCGRPGPSQYVVYPYCGCAGHSDATHALIERVLWCNGQAAKAGQLLRVDL